MSLILVMERDGKSVDNNELSPRKISSKFLPVDAG